MIQIKSYGRLFGKMWPVFFSIGSLSVSSFGVFLALGFLFGIFLVWRLCRAWDLDEEKTLDLILLTFIGGIVGARLYFAIENFSVFLSSPLNLILINKIPGLSFWGGILGGWLSLFFLARRGRQDFWLLADIASVGFLGGLIFAEAGCFLGGCNVGIPSKVFFAANMVGLVAKRVPVQILEVLLLVLGLRNIWSKALHFHQRGKIVSLTFIYLGFIKLMLDPLKQDHSDRVFSAVLIFLGLTVYYRVTRQNPISQLKSLGKFLLKLVSDSETRKKAVHTLGKLMYNQKTAYSWKIRNFKKLLRRSNVKFS